MAQAILIGETVDIRMSQHQSWKWIPTHLTIEQFEQFVLPHLSVGSRGPQPKLSLHVIFNYILKSREGRGQRPSLIDFLKLLYLGCQWKELPIATDKDGQPEIHYSRIYRAFRRFEAHGCFDNIFVGSVFVLHQKELLELSIIHGV